MKPRSIAPVSQDPRPLLVDLARSYGGAEVRVLALGQAFRSLGCGAAVLEGYPLAKALRQAGVPTYAVAADKTDPRIPARLAEVAHREGFNLFDAHNIQSVWWTALVSGHPSLAKIATVHSSVTLEHTRRVKARLYEWIQAVTLPGFDRIITVSKFLCGQLARQAAPEKITRIPNGVSIQRFGLEEGLAVRRELGLNPEDLVIGAAARLEPAKGMDLLLEACALLAPDWPKLKCVIAGSGRQADSLQELVHRLGLENRVLFTGFYAPVPRLIEALDVYVLPSRTEGIPIALLEACACARPVVAAAVGGVPEVVTDEVNGLLVAPEDAPSLARQIDRLLRDRNLASRLGCQAAADTAAHFSLEAMLQSTWNAYQVALQDHLAGQP